MPQIIDIEPGTVTVRIKAGSEWRGVKYFEAALFNLSDAYAKYVVETLRIAEYVEVDNQGIIQE